MHVGKRVFFREFLRDRKVAALQPSSPHLVKRLMRRLDVSRAKLVVEFGPGNGAATRRMLASLAPDARCVAIERNPHFADALRGWGDPRLEVIEGDVLDMSNYRDLEGAADAVIASIPFSYLSPAERERVVETAAALLGPNGAFIVFHQYSPLMIPHLKKNFREVKVEFEPLNVLPCFLFHCRK